MIRVTKKQGLVTSISDDAELNRKGEKAVISADYAVKICFYTEL